MIISKKELLDLFEMAYSLSIQAAALSKELTENLSTFADSNNLSKKSVRAAFNAFKAFKEGKVSVTDEDYFTMQAIIEEHFSENSEETADEVSA